MITDLIQVATSDISHSIYYGLVSIFGLLVGVFAFQLLWRLFKRLTRSAIDKEFDSFYDDRY